MLTTKRDITENELLYLLAEAEISWLIFSSRFKDYAPQNLSCIYQ